MERSAVYIDIMPDEEKRDLKSILSKICNKFKYYNKPGEALKVIKAAVNTTKIEWGLVVLDVRGTEKAPEVTQNFMKWIQEHYITQRLMLIYDKGMEKSLPDICNYNIDFLIPDPWTKELMERVIGRLKRDTLEVEEEKCIGNTINDIEKAFEDYERYKTLAETQSSFFLSKSEKLDKIVKSIKNINNILLQIDWDDKNRDLIGKLFRYTEKLEQTNNTIVEFVKKYTGEIEDEDYFDLNILLNVINTELNSELERNNIELVYKISNKVPSRLLGTTSIIKNIIIDSTRLIISGGIREKIILIVDTAGSDNNLILKVGFTSTKLVIEEMRNRLERLQHSPEAYKLSKIIEKYGGKMIFDSYGEVVLTLEFPSKIKDKRSYRLPKKDMMHKRVLIVYGDLDISASLKEMLEYFHFIVDNAYSWESAVEYMNKLRYDIIYVQSELSQNILNEIKKRGLESKVVAIVDRKSDGEEEIEDVDSVIYQPYTQQAIFDTILDIYYNESTYLTQEAIEAYKNYIDLMASGKKTIIISNDYTDRMTVELMLDGSGLDINTFPTIDEALEELSDAEILIVNLDDVMKSMSELKSLVGYVSEYNMENKTIGFIDKNSSDINELKETTGVKHILKKPLNPEQFYRVLTDNVILEDGE